MGNINDVSLKRDEISAFVQATCFTSNEIRGLWLHFREISSGADDKCTINRTQFQAAMLFRDALLCDRIFRAFDTDNDDLINFAEFLLCLSACSNKAPAEQKLRLSFRIYDHDNDDKISRDELAALVSATMREREIVVTEEEVDSIVTETMRAVKTAVPDMISYDEYRAFMSTRQHAVSFLSLNISSIIEEYSQSHGISLDSPRPSGDQLSKKK